VEIFLSFLLKKRRILCNIFGKNLAKIIYSLIATPSSQPSYTRNKNPADSATGSNKIPITRGQQVHKVPAFNFKNKTLMDKSVTNSSFSKNSKPKEGKTKISK
jgi:hypothetical protein